eukprot:TRINITY_DN920_c2_g1_i1.p1 TRINITY_DN920_c2_g1~~TRINITY_DN920_c2_g1_i1.p1  ORF type:complete len:119 (-),score=38.52 TRINITY_DN920_c2_g1_i1:8-337(-)
MASIGLLVQHYIRFPGCEKAPAGWGATFHPAGVNGMYFLFMVCGVLELWWREEDGKEPGNFGDPAKFNMYNDEMRLKEINNGRFAMICVAGILAADIMTHKDAIQQFGL